jgi:hypothetical protein
MSKNSISFVYYPDCYFYADWLMLNLETSGKVYASSNPFDLSTSTHIFYASNNVINTGDITVWPALSNGINVYSDIPVGLKINFPEEGKGYGQNGYSTHLQLGGAIIPFNYPIRVELTDQSGHVYTSPYHTFDRSLGCQKNVELDFYNGVFTWK